MGRYELKIGVPVDKSETKMFLTLKSPQILNFVSCIVVGKLHGPSARSHAETGSEGDATLTETCVN